jgi:hypothetical protein
MAQDKATIELELKAGQVEYLEEIAAKYSLPDSGKVIRCLIDYARDEPSQERVIFEVMRCLGC